MLLCHESHVGVKEATEQRDCTKANTGSSIARHSIEHEDSLGAQCVEQWCLPLKEQEGEPSAEQQSLPCNSQEGEPSVEHQCLPCKLQDNEFHVKCKHGAVKMHLVKEQSPTFTLHTGLEDCTSVPKHYFMSSCLLEGIVQELGISADVFYVIKWHKIDRPRKKEENY